MKATLFLLFGLLICQVSSRRHGKHDSHRPHGNSGCGSGNHMNGCKPSRDCIANEGYCIAKDKAEDCEGMLFPKECTSVHCSCCVPVTPLEDECATGENDCPADTTCEDKDLGYDCLCETGYQKCGDVDECTDTPDICGANSICTNTYGSYECSCIEGYQIIGDTCEDIDECADVDTCPPNSVCVNSPGGFDCVCDTGFEEANGLCLDIDECKDPQSCPKYNECVNTVGSYECICIEGYEIVSENCEDIDECDVSINPCGNGVCDNTDGSYVCNCFDGFEVVGGTCEDIDECLGDIAEVCGKLTLCTNTPGSFTCSCLEGQKSDDGACYDIDECLSNPCDSTETCINTPGSYTCECKSMFCASKCFMKSLYVEGVGCVFRIIGGLTYSEAKKRCSEEHQGLISIDSQEIADQLELLFQTSVTGSAWIGGADASVATTGSSSDCLAIDIQGSDVSSQPCDTELADAFCVTSSV